jgi:MYXO-CTERM domain-containing protein
MNLSKASPERLAPQLPWAPRTTCGLDCKMRVLSLQVGCSSTCRRSRARLALRVLPWAVALVAFLVPLTANAATFYVAPTGSDAAAGTMAAPFASWAQAQTAAAPGDTVYFRGGTYAFTDATSTCTSPTATVNAVVLSKSGTAANPINYWAFPGETPVFDFSGINDITRYSCRQVGIRVEADWLHLKGFEVKGTLQLNNLNHESWCVYVIGGNNNIFELMNAHHNMGPGFFVQTGGNNTFLNCDSHENEDTLTSNGDGQSADGFGCHPNQVGDTGNLFHGCRAWWNSDDSWDFINATEACTVEYSWAWYAGYKPDAITNGAPVALAAGNGNGFKGGGYGAPQVLPNTPTIPLHTIRFNAAFFNKANGVYANHEIVSPFFYNNTSYNNGVDFDMLGLDGTTVTSVGTLRNNLAFGRTIMADFGNPGPISDMFNSWDIAGFTVSAATFQSLTFNAPASCPAPYAPGGTPCCLPTDMTCFSGMASARNADGSLPVLPFLRLSTTAPAGANAVDKGTNVGLPFSGSAPDLGCFESGLVFDGSDGGVTGGGSSSSSSSSSGGSTDSGAGSSSSSSGGTPRDGGTGSSGGAADAGFGSSGGASNDAGAGASSGGSGADASSSGDSNGSSGATGSGSGSSSGAGSPTGIPGDAGAFSGQGETASGCGCRTTRASTEGGGAWLVALGALVVARRRRVADKRHAD